jgi:hypothetical protein
MSGINVCNLLVISFQNVIVLIGLSELFEWFFNHMMPSFELLNLRSIFLGVCL